MNDTANPVRDTISPELREKFQTMGLLPLWESPHAHKAASAAYNGHLWRWRDMRDIMLEVGENSSPTVVERRVIQMLDPKARYPDGEGTVGSINATMQMLKTGEQARPHRHSMNALRFILESSGGAKTVVDGKDCPMEQFDLILTPAWTWHTHVHTGPRSIIWLDVLDVALHRFLGTEAFQPGPMLEQPHQLADDAFSVVGMTPVVAYDDHGYSPLFRFPWVDAVRALQAAPVGPDGGRRVKYTNPLTGGSCLSLLDVSLNQIDAGCSTAQVTVSADIVFCAIEGRGSIEIGDSRVEWEPHDIFTVPNNRPFRITADKSGTARLFVVSNVPVFRKLGLYTRSVKK